MSGNYTDVREMSGISLKVMELSGKKSCHGKHFVQMPLQCSTTGSSSLVGMKICASFMLT